MAATLPPSLSPAGSFSSTSAGASSSGSGGELLNVSLEGGRFFTLHSDAVRGLYEMFVDAIARSPPQEQMQRLSGEGEPPSLTCTIHCCIPPHDDPFTFTSSPSPSKAEAQEKAREAVCRHLLLHGLWSRLTHSQRAQLQAVATPAWQRFKEPRVFAAAEKERRELMAVPAFTAPQLLTQEWVRKPMGKEEPVGTRFSCHELSPALSTLFPRVVLLTSEPLPSFASVRPIQLHLPGVDGRPASTEPVAHCWKQIGAVRLTDAQLDVAKQWMAKTMRPVMGMAPGEWEQGPRKYVLLPLIPQALPGERKEVETPEAAERWEKLLRILPSRRPVDGPVLEEEVWSRMKFALRVDWRLIHHCLSPVPSPLTTDHFDRNHRTISRYILTTLHNGALFKPIGLTSPPPLLPLGEGCSIDPPWASAFKHLHKPAIAFPPELPLIEAVPYSATARDLKAQQGEEAAPSAASDAPLLLPPSLLHVYPVPRRLLEVLRCVPSYLYGLECYLLTLAFLTKVALSRSFFLPMHRALVARGTLEQRVERDRLTFLGLLYERLLRVTAGFCTFPDFQPGELTKLGESSGDALRFAALQALLPFVRFTPFAARMPIAGLEGSRVEQVTVGSLEESAAAVIGACLLHGGQQQVEQFLTFLGLPALVGPAPSVDHIDTASLPADALAFLDSSLPQLESFLDYHFISPVLLLQAFTHSSAELGFSYERLEHLGDAVLNYLIGLAVFRVSEASKSLQLRDAHFLTKETWRLRSNKTLSHLSDELGLPDYVICGKAVGRKPPKVADVLEALIGAVYVDTGMNIEHTQRVWERIVHIDLSDVAMGEGTALVMEPRITLRKRSCTSAADQQQYGHYQQQPQQSESSAPHRSQVAKGLNEKAPGERQHASPSASKRDGRWQLLNIDRTAQRRPGGGEGGGGDEASRAPSDHLTKQLTTGFKPSASQPHTNRLHHKALTTASLSDA